MAVDEDASVQEDGGETLRGGDAGEDLEIRNSEVHSHPFPHPDKDSWNLHWP